MQCCSSNNTSNIPQKELSHETSEADYHHSRADCHRDCYRSHPHGSGNTPEKAMTNFMEELLQDAEAAGERRRLELNLLRADETLGAITILESELEKINSMCDQELALIEQYRERQTVKLSKRISWLTWNLELFIRSSNQKTVDLPRGELKLRMGKPKVEVIDVAAFMKIAAKNGLLREKPAETVPDLNSIHNYVRVHQTPPPGCALTPATVNFSYKTKGTGNDNRERSEAETGAPAEQASEAQAAA
jgi:hypothetical protein